MLSTSEVRVRDTGFGFVTFTLKVKLPPGAVRLSGVAVLFTVMLSQDFVAAAEFEPTPFVLRVRTTPPTVTVTCAETVVVPVRADVSVIEQEPVPPETVQGFA